MIKQNPKDFLDSKETAHELNHRLRVFIQEYKDYKKRLNKPLRVLDIGGGRDPKIFEYKFEDDKYYVCDYYDNINKNVDGYKKIDLNTQKLSEIFKNEKFDVIFCGEVLEHVFSPDFLVEEIKKLMHIDSILIISTPNFGYYMNRIMLLFGISPFFLENSSEFKFGRKFKFLGNMNSTEGHIRLFTHDALKEFYTYYNFKIEKIIGTTGPWKFFLDVLISKIIKSLSASNVFVLKIK